MIYKKQYNYIYREVFDISMCMKDSVLLSTFSKIDQHLGEKNEIGLAL